MSIKNVADCVSTIKIKNNEEYKRIPQSSSGNGSVSGSGSGSSRVEFNDPKPHLILNHRSPQEFFQEMFILNYHLVNLCPMW